MIAKTDYTDREHEKIGSIYGFDIIVKSQKSVKEGVDILQNRFYVRGEGDYLYSFNNGNIAADPRLASQNFINALGTIEPLLEKLTGDRDKLAADIPLLKEVVEGKWRKEDELATMKEEFKELDNRIMVSLKPITENEGKEERTDAVHPSWNGEGGPQRQSNPVNPSRNDNSGPQDNRHIPSRLREIADASGGRIVIGGVPERKPDDPGEKNDKGRKI